MNIQAARPCEVWPGNRVTPNHLRTQRHKLQAIRVVGWFGFLIEVSVLAAYWHRVLTLGGHWMNYLWSLVAVLAWFHGLPLLARWFTRVVATVHPTGDGWRIGKYSEADLRQLIHKATAELPPRARGFRVCITDLRCLAAWTWLSIIWPGGERTKPIMLTSGSLHYLEPNEVIAVLLHEIAHHLPSNRVAVCGGWLLADATFHAVAFSAYCQIGSGGLAVAVFVLLRGIACSVTALTVRSMSRSIEHFCDLFAAERVGSAPMINALLKVGEDEELTEVVLAWVAHAMIYEKHMTWEDLTLAFTDARPYGRIFHENLFRHAAEVSKILLADQKSPTAKNHKRRQENPELKEFVQRRRMRQPRRIRWRRFDGNGDGSLTGEEIARLCEVLEAHPDCVLVTSQAEFEPTTHPRYRDRILVLHNARCSAEAVARFPRESITASHSVSSPGC